VHLRVVSDQPWDVPADLLVIPFVGEPALDGLLAPIDQRTGGELKALAAFGELKPDRYAAAFVPAGECRAGRLLAISAGSSDSLSRQVVVRLGSAIARRVADRKVRTLAIWLGASPYRLRDCFEWLFRTSGRPRAVGSALLGYGVLLIAVAFTY